MLDYDKESGEYRLLDLLTPSGVRSGLTQSSSLARAGALLFKTVSSSAIPRAAGGGCAAYTTSHSCLDASARMGGSCGWCQASGMCVRGDPWGPCRRSACEGAHAACGVWHSTSGVLGAVDSGQSVTAGAAIASTATMVESLDGGGATSATSAAAAAASSPNSTHPACTACAGGGMGLAGGAAEALAHCAACAAALGRPSSTTTPTSGPTAVTTMSALPLPASATATGGAAFRLAAFALHALQHGPCSRLASPVCAALIEAKVTAVPSATVEASSTPLAPASSLVAATPRPGNTTQTPAANSTSAAASTAAASAASAASAAHCRAAPLRHDPKPPSTCFGSPSTVSSPRRAARPARRCRIRSRSIST